MRISNELKEKLSQFDQETSQILLQLIERQRREIDFFRRNWIFKHRDLYIYLSDEAIMAVRDVDERNELASQRLQIENSYKLQMNTLKRKQKIEYDNFSRKRLNDRALIFTTDKNTNILSYRLNSPLPSPIKISTNTRPSRDLNPENYEEKPKKVRKSYRNHQTDNNIENIIKDINFNDFNDTHSLTNNSHISNHQFLNNNANTQSNPKKSTRISGKGNSNSSFLSSRSKFISNTSITGHISSNSHPPTIKPKSDNKEEINVLDIKSLDKHFKKTTEIRLKKERERQARFEENFSYQVNSKDVLNYKRKNLSDNIILEKIQNKGKSANQCFNLAEIESNNSIVSELNDSTQKVYKKVGTFSVDSKKIEEEEMKIAPINKLDSFKLVSESSSDSFEQKIPTNNISLEYSYESYYSEYEVEEKIYLKPKKKPKKKSKK